MRQRVGWGSGGSRRGGDKFANIVEAAKDVGIANMGGEAKIIGESDGYRSSK